MDVRGLQKPLKDRYRGDPTAARITMRAEGATGDSPLACSVDLGRAIQQAQAHAGVGGQGTAACSGDLLLGALAACAQLTCQLVATAMGVPVREVRVTVDGDVDLRGTLGMSPDVPVGFERIRARFDVDAPEATPEQVERLRQRTEELCVVMQTLVHPPPIDTEWA